MKKIISIFIFLMIIICININTYAARNTQSILDSDIKGVTLISNSGIKVDAIKKHGFNMVFLNVDNIRNSVKPYNTNYRALRLLNTNILKLEKANIDYTICFTSGPGFSRDGKISTIFKNKFEMNYFSQMAKEIIKRYISHNNFKAASISISAPDIPEAKYYEAQNYIINKVRTTFKDIPFIYTLDPLAFEEDLKYLPNLKLPNVIVNLTIGLKGLTYPGCGAGYKTSCDLNKNSILANLEKLKEWQDNANSDSIITIKIPWVKSSEVLLQDSFEIFKMLEFNYNLSYGNSLDVYDFTSNTDVLKTLDRHNR